MDRVFYYKSNTSTDKASVNSYGELTIMESICLLAYLFDCLNSFLNIHFKLFLFILYKLFWMSKSLF